ncbi:ANTAR domain-containing protein [Streptomyces sp. NBC_00467]|uniref:ANTAR domain-containing protein n=1 Tax=Streptomyces sp. NBC_00467 TaxID=2975752 RepID=UPI003FA6952F
MRKLQQALASHTVINQAMGIVMALRRLSPDKAFLPYRSMGTEESRGPRSFRARTDFCSCCPRGRTRAHSGACGTAAGISALRRETLSVECR